MDEASQTHFGTDLLTDGARRKLTAAGAVFAAATRAATPSLKRFAEAARQYLGESVAEKETPKDDAPDPLDEERRDLLARFEELERRDKENEPSAPLRSKADERGWPSD